MIYKTEPDIYEIRIKESLSSDPIVWFEGMRLSVQADGSTLLTGAVIDQSALLGLLSTIAGLGLTLVSVNVIEHLDGTNPRTMCGGAEK